MPKLGQNAITWEQRRLGDLLKVSKERNNKNEYTKEQVLSVSREVGTVNQIEYQGRSFAGADISGYKVVHLGQMIYTKSPLKDAPYGIFQNVTVEGIVSPLYAVYNSTDKALASFIGLQLKDDNLATHYLSPLVSKGAKNTINVTDEGALGGIVFHPSIAEQQEIIDFFTALDHLITLHQRECDLIVKTKKSYLQKMFPKNGEDKPEIRFAGFTDAWEECRLGEVKDVRDGTHDSPKYQNKGFPLITSKNIKESGLDMSNVSLISFEDFNAINQRSKVDIGDIIFGMIGTIGNPIILERDDFAIKNVALLKNGGSIDNRFLLQLLKSPVFELYMKKENAGGTQKFLGLSQIRNLNFFVPELSEQQRIGEFFSQLDNLLTLYKRKVEHLQEQKKSLLKQMFI